jgi:uncharacterized protein (DUF1778 family)
MSGELVKGQRIEIRVDLSELNAYDKAAAAANLDRSEWMRAVLNRASRRYLSIAERG